MMKVIGDSLCIGFDISQLAHRGGVATYTDHLSQELEKILDLEMVYFYSSMRKAYTGDLKNVKTFKLPPTLFEVLFNKTRKVPIEKFIGKIDVFHSSDWTQPPTKAKKVTTYHDVIPLKYPAWSTPKIVAVHKKRLELVEKEIDMVIAVSNATKQDLLEISRIPEEKITVVYEGVSDDFKVLEKEKIEAFRKKMNLPEKFILSIGGVGERRNLKRVKEVCKDYSLIITGESIPYISNEDMVLLYNCASLLLYPSFYEGFGLPVLEAMACGVPVITSNVSSLPEVGGEAALYVDPENQDQIKAKVRELMEDKQLQNELIKKGLNQVKGFSWKETAEKTAAIYKNIVS